MPRHKTPHTAKRILAFGLVRRPERWARSPEPGEPTFWRSSSWARFSSRLADESARSMQLVSVHPRIHDETLEALPQQQSSAISFRLGQQGQEDISLFGQDLSDSENLKRPRQVEHFGDGGRLFHVPAAQRVG